MSEKLGPESSQPYQEHVSKEQAKGHTENAKPWVSDEVLGIKRSVEREGVSDTARKWHTKEALQKSEDIDQILDSNRSREKEASNHPKGKDGTMTRRGFLTLGGAVAGLGALEFIRRKLGINLDEKRADESDKISDKIEENKAAERAGEIIRNDNERAGLEARERIDEETKKTAKQTQETKKALWDTAEDNKDLGQNIE